MLHVRASLGRLGGLALLATLFLGCQLDSPTPLSGPGFEPDPVENNPSLYSEDIGSPGGTLSGPNATLTVPSSALSSVTTLTMTYNAAAANEVVMGPAGQQFQVAVTLTMEKPTGHQPGEVYHIFLWNESAEEWDDLGGTSNGPTVSVAISHFSRYGVIKIS